MTWDEWQPRYRRLVKTYGKTESSEQCAAYFEALQSYSEGVIEHAIARVIAEEKYWPAVAEIRSRVQAYLAGHVYTPSTCPDCHGDGWVDAPDQEHHGRQYRYVTRCRRCWQGKESAA